jgi:hypothetical protein
MQIIVLHAVSASYLTVGVYITKANWLMLFAEIITAYG